jgi:NADPH2:quinone reductase
MSKAIRIHRTGGPEVMVWEEIEVGRPGPGEVRLRHTAIGLNYIDTYLRSGLYPLASLPAVLGREGAGVVDRVGEGVTGFVAGDRVAYAMHPGGSYSEEAIVSAERLLKLPDGIEDRVAAAMMLKGLTAQYLLRRTFRVEAGQTILFHAAAGGVGLIACQWARALGAKVIGTVGSRDKVELARAHGCDHVIVYTEESFAPRVREITGGAGVPVVYDSVGKDTFEGSLDCLAPRGLMTSFGNASGPPPPFSILTLSTKGSLYLTRPALATYVARRDELEQAAAELFDVVLRGVVKVEIRQSYALRDAARAHRDLEARKTTGSTVLIP